ncbi:hypothetical protein CPB84DRAFT_1847461 [Gymnopilus junonius]|uniref:Uncharacterized protein n=1 Tax=Gymnopilus junonius TaxID=109634 RepID=A0A9P5NK59_GYMJU|nr:hypothetical protein CPB84DRAFT_1847461 [Gymnopilus junonius]
MNLQQTLSLGVFSSYFLAIIFLLSLISRSIYVSKTFSSANNGKALIFFGLTVASFTHTWFYMFRYMAWSFANYEHSLQATQTQDTLHRVASWLHGTSLFEEAWSTVCFHPLNWWWSEQLCTYTTGVWTVFIAIEGKRHNIEHLWAYMLLGQIVAISVASNLFYLALILSQPPRTEAAYNLRANPRLWMSVILSLATVAFSHPHLGGPTSTSSEQSPIFFSMDMRNLFRLVQIVVAGIHIRTVLAAVNFLKESSPSASSHIVSVAWDVLYSHPAQSSIGWDVVWTTISFIIWIVVKPLHPMEGSRSTSVLYLLLATPVSSIGVTAPYVLRPIAEPSNPVGDKLE